VYTRPVAAPDRSARSRNLSLSTTTTSLIVLPSSTPLSGSLDVADTRAMAIVSGLCSNSARTSLYL
jgi:hypothetical protein